MDSGALIRASGDITLNTGSTAILHSYQGDYNFDTDAAFEGWTDGGQMSGLAVLDGTMRGVSVGIDPIVNGPTLSGSGYAGASYPYVLVRTRMSPGSHSSEIFYAINGGGFVTGQEKLVTQSYDGYTYYTLVFDFSGDSVYMNASNKITRLRYDPTTTSGDAFYVDCIKISSTSSASAIGGTYQRGVISAGGNFVVGSTSTGGALLNTYERTFIYANAIQLGGTLTKTSMMNLSSGSVIEGQNMTLLQFSTLTHHPAVSMETNYGLELRIGGTLDVQVNGWIDLSQKGYRGGLAGLGGAKGTGSGGQTTGKAGGSGTAGYGFGGPATNGGGTANGTATNGSEYYSGSYYYGGGGGAGGNGGTGTGPCNGGTGGARGTAGAYWNNTYPDSDPRYPGPGGDGPGGGGGGGDGTAYPNHATDGSVGSASGGSGGGYLRVTATNITISGSILVDAGNGGNGGAGGLGYPSYSSSGGGGGGGHGGGGGSGGGIYLRASGTLTVVSGYSLSAKGGNGGTGGAGGDGYTSLPTNYDGYIGSGGNGGSGGKIAVYYGTLVGTLTPVVTGGSGGALAAYPPGQLGTAVVGTAGAAGASTTQALGTSFPQEYNFTSDLGKTFSSGAFDAWRDRKSVV
jgi:hypothetical protein